MHNAIVRYLLSTYTNTNSYSTESLGSCFYLALIFKVYKVLLQSAVTCAHFLKKL